MLGVVGGDQGEGGEGGTRVSALYPGAAGHYWTTARDHFAFGCF